MKEVVVPKGARYYAGGTTTTEARYPINIDPNSPTTQAVQEAKTALALAKSPDQPVTGCDSQNKSQ